MAFDPQLEQAKYLQGFLHPEDLPHVAADALEAGYDSRSLRMLAGLEKPTVWDAEPLWRKAWEEIGERIPDKDESLLITADWVISRCEAKEFHPKYAASILARMAWQNDYDRRLLDIYCLVDYIDIGLAKEEDLVKAFEQFKRRDFYKRPLDIRKAPEMNQHAKLGQLRRFRKYTKLERYGILGILAFWFVGCIATRQYLTAAICGVFGLALFASMSRRELFLWKLRREAQMKELTARVETRVAELFLPEERDRVRALLVQYRMDNSSKGTERIHLNILSLSKGSVDKVAEFVRLANTDYRDLIMAAEYELVDGKIVKRNAE